MPLNIILTRAEKIGAIRDLPLQLRDAISQLNEEQLDLPYREGGWTIRQVVHHLADSHMNAFIRFKLVLTEDHPTIKPYDQDSWAVLSDYSMPIEVSLGILDGLHARWATLLDSIDESDWSRTAYHPENGEMTLADLLDTYSAHGAKHIGHIKGTV